MTTVEEKLAFAIATIKAVYEMSQRFQPDTSSIKYVSENALKDLEKKHV